ncbi:outer membrane protein assembly factor BamD [Lyticum sinuosum]|uniref:Outer membrane protein assembly factor BamD n=1 Tax=Lyticum sinuosum TaxID=1332059 RepID=A0AAE4VLU4_9RICK|nr:outer membrane protein assembly factor BamD [Lyticum sinuosum]MDZ5761201.1 Outer membrane protein assembly factor BamD precursor [Lyticum sinuosum]
MSYKKKIVKNLAIYFSIIFLSSCSNNEKIIPDTISQSDYELFSEGKKIMFSDHKKAIKVFDNIETYYPSSIYNERSIVLKAYLYYINSKFDDAEITVENFLENYPSSSYCDYMHYLLAMTLCMQISDVQRDQSNTVKSINKIKNLIINYPNSEYSQELKEIVLYIQDILASKEMNIGRFYQKNNDIIAALKRFQYVNDNYNNSVVAPEAMYRTIEIYESLRLHKEAVKNFHKLQNQYPQSKWTNYANKRVNNYQN